MNLMKRISTVFLCSLMIFSASMDLCLTRGFAQEETKASEQAIIEKLEAFEILDAPKDAAETIKRKDMIPIMIDCMKAESLVSSPNGTTPFLDISVDDENIAGYSFLYESGYIRGTQDRLFYPERNLSLSEAASFIVRMYGYDAFGSSDMTLAAQMGLFDGISVNTQESLTYADVYKMIYNALSAVTLEYDMNSVKLNPDMSILNDKYGIYRAEGIVKSTPLTGLFTAEDSCNDGFIQINETIYECGKNEYYSFIGANVSAYYRESEMGANEILYIENKNTKTVKINSDDIDYDKTTNSRIYYRSENNVTKYAELEAAAAVIYNEVSYKGYGSLSGILPKYGTIEFIDNSGNGKYDVIKITAYENYVVGYTDVNNETVIEKVNGSKLDFDSENDNLEIFDTESGKAVSFSQIKPDDVLTVAQSKNTSGKKYVLVYIMRNIIEGSVSSVYTKEDNTIYMINDTEYTAAPNFMSYIESGYTAAPQPGKTMSFYLDCNGRIAMADYKNLSGGLKYGVVGKLFWDDEAETLNLWIFNENGEWIKAPLAEKVNLDGRRVKARDSKDREKIIADVKVQEVVRYKFSGTEFTDIDTEKLNGTNASAEADRGNLTLIASGDRFNQRFNMCSDDSDISKSWFVKQNSVIVFKVPELANINETNKYGVEKKITTHFYYSGSGSNITQVKEGYKVFVTSIEDINTAECILLKGCDSYAYVEASSPYYMVSGIGESVNNDNELCYKLSLARNGSEMEFFTVPDSFKKIEYKYNDENSRTYIVTDANLKELNLEKGDVVQLLLDGDNNVEGICVVYRINQNKATEYQKFSVWDANFHWEESSSSGTLEAVDIANKIVKFKCMNRMARKTTSVNGVTYPAGTVYESPLIYQSLANSAKITVYDRNSNSILNGSLSSLLPGDKLIMNMYYADSISDIIAIRE